MVSKCHKNCRNDWTEFSHRDYHKYQTRTGSCLFRYFILFQDGVPYSAAPTNTLNGIFKIHYMMKSVNQIENLMDYSRKLWRILKTTLKSTLYNSSCKREEVNAFFSHIVYILHYFIFLLSISVLTFYLISLTRLPNTYIYIIILYSIKIRSQVWPRF